MGYYIEMKDSIEEMREVAMRAKDALCEFCDLLERTSYGERENYRERHEGRYGERYEERYGERSPRYREEGYRGGRYRY